MWNRTNERKTKSERRNDGKILQKKKLSEWNMKQTYRMEITGRMQKKSITHCIWCQRWVILFIWVCTFLGFLSYAKAFNICTEWPKSLTFLFFFSFHSTFLQFSLCLCMLFRIEFWGFGVRAAKILWIFIRFQPHNLVKSFCLLQNWV